MNRIIFFLFLLYSCQISAAGTEPADTLVYVDKAERASLKKAIVPVAMTGVGLFGVWNGWAHNVNDDVRTGMEKMRGDNYCRVDDYLQYLPTVANMGLGLVGVKSKHDLKERTAITATAYLLMAAMVNGMKYTVREKRPDTNARNSFPSGHTATAFMGAELVRMEYGNGIGAAAYVTAGAVAFLRLYNDRHWLNDVIAGAGIGMLSARLAFWLMPFERKLFGWKPSVADNMCVVPVYYSEDKGIGLMFSARF